MMAKKKLNQDHYIDCCNDCGMKRYKIVQDADGITVHGGICPLCKKSRMIIPARDWKYMEGDDSKWD